MRCSAADGAPAALPVAASHFGGGKHVPSGGCPFPALYASFTLPGICSDRAFANARTKFVAALTAAAGPGGFGLGLMHVRAPSLLLQCWKLLLDGSSQRSVPSAPGHGMVGMAQQP